MAFRVARSNRKRTQLERTLRREMSELSDLEQILEADGTKLFVALYSCASTLARLGNTQDGLPIAERAVVLAHRTFRDSSESISSAYELLRVYAHLISNGGDPVKGRHLDTRILKYYEATFGEKSVEVGRALSSVAADAAAMDDWPSAVQLANRALTITTARHKLWNRLDWSIARQLAYYKKKQRITGSLK
jgi:hypothetical protein